MVDKNRAVRHQATLGHGARSSEPGSACPCHTLAVPGPGGTTVPSANITGNKSMQFGLNASLFKNLVFVTNN